jgi:ABC-2 type transport system permease protein
LLLHYFRFNLAAGMEYRASFIVQVLGMALNNGAFIVFWLILFDRIGSSLRGYFFQDVMFLWAMIGAGFGLAAIFMGNAPHLSRIIYRGELDVYLLQPKPVLANLLASRMSISGWGDLLFGLLLFGLTQTPTLPKIALFLFFSLMAAVVFTSLRVLYHSLTFFLGNSEELASTASNLIISFSLYPGTLFEGPSVWMLHSLVPAALVAYIPADIFRRFDAGKMLLLIGGDLVFVLAALVLFHLGLRRYESGNRMGTRL